MTPKMRSDFFVAREFEHCDAILFSKPYLYMTMSANIGLNSA